MRIMLLLVSPLVEIILPQAQHRPSIVLLQADNLGNGIIGLHIFDRVDNTPNIDSVGMDVGVYSKKYLILGSPAYTPVRAALLVRIEDQLASLLKIADCAFHDAWQNESVYHCAVLNKIAVQRRIISDCVLRINATWPSLPQVFSCAGYFTPLSDKWHLSSDEGMPSVKAYVWDFVKAHYDSDLSSSLWNLWPEEMKWIWGDTQLLSDAIVTEADMITSAERSQELFLYVNHSILPYAPLLPSKCDERMTAVGPAKCNFDALFKNGFRWSEERTNDLMRDASEAAEYRRVKALWTGVVAPLARALAHWIFDTIAKTSDLLTSLYDPCKVGVFVHGLTVEHNLTQNINSGAPQRKRQRSHIDTRRQQGQSHSEKEIEQTIAENAPANTLFETGEDRSSLSWSMIERNELPPSYHHIRVPPRNGVWCAFDACFVASSISPTYGAELSALNLDARRNSALKRGNPRGFILVANNPSLNSISMRCPPPGYRIVRFNKCKSRWPPPSPEDVIALRCAKVPSGYWGLDFPSKEIACSATFGGVNFSTMLIGGNGGILKDQDPLIAAQIWRLSKDEEADNMRKISFSSGSTMAFLLRRAFPHKPIIALGFNFHREYPCTMHSFSDCPRSGHNYTLERLLLAALPRLRVLQTSKEVDKFSSEWLPPSSSGHCSS